MPIVWVELAWALAIGFWNDPGSSQIKAAPGAAAEVGLHLMPRAESHASSFAGALSFLEARGFAATDARLALVGMVRAAANCSAVVLIHALVLQALLSACCFRATIQSIQLPCM